MEARRKLFKSPARHCRAGGHADPEVLDLLAAALQRDLQLELIAAVEVRDRTIEGEQRRHFSGKALLEVGGFERAALDGHGTVSGCDQETDRRQRTTGAIGLDVGVDADALVVAGGNLDLAFGEVALPLWRLRLRKRRRRRQAHQGSGNEPAWVRCRHAALSTGYPTSSARHYHNRGASTLACLPCSAY